MAKTAGKFKSPAKSMKSAKPAPAKPPKGRSAVKKTGVKAQARVLKTRIEESGKTSRIKGHVSATVRQKQAKRDQKLETSRTKESGKPATLPVTPSVNTINLNNMNIEVSTKGGCSAEFVSDMTSLIAKGLSRYASRITRVEAYFEDMNGPKGGIDHRCGLEARLAARKPVKVTHVAAKSDLALKGAIAKLDRLLKSSLGKLKSVKGKMSASGLVT